MKTIQSIMTAVTGRSRQILIATAALLLAVLATNVEATPFGDPTTNDWDCVMTGGGQDGIMFFHFTTDIDPTSGLLTFQAVFANAGSRANPNLARGGTGFGRTNTPLPVFTNIFGGGFVTNGTWFWNPRGQLVGSFNFLIMVTPTTFLTNNVSFTGTVTPLKSITLLASSSYGNIHFHGVPLVAITAPVTDFTWTATRNVDGVNYGEIFNMSPSSVPNMYNLVGAGPSYTYAPGSFCLISSQKKIGFAIWEAVDVTNIIATTGTKGSFSVTKTSMTANTVGLSTITTSRTHFSAAAVENAPLP